jgi:hypothetical protein
MAGKRLGHWGYEFSNLARTGISKCPYLKAKAGFFPVDEQDVIGEYICSGCIHDATDES